MAERLKQESEEAERGLREGAGRRPRQGLHHRRDRPRGGQGRGRRAARRGRGRPQPAARGGRGAHRRDQGEGALPTSAPSPARRPRRSSPSLTGAEVGRGEVDEAVTAVDGEVGGHRMFDAPFWALLALIIFLGIVVYLKVPGQITGGARQARRQRSATSSTRRGGCARRPRRCSPTTSAGPARPRPRPRRSSTRPSARPRRWRSRPRSASRNTSPAAPGWPSRRSPRPRLRRCRKCAPCRPTWRLPPPRSCSSERVKGAGGDRAHRQDDRRSPHQAQLSLAAAPRNQPPDQPRSRRGILAAQRRAVRMVRGAGSPSRASRGQREARPRPPQSRPSCCSRTGAKLRR